MWLINDKNSKIFDLSINDIFDNEEFYDIKLFGYFYDYDWQLILYIDNELFVQYFVNYLKRKTELTSSNNPEDYN